MSKEPVKTPPENSVTVKLDFPFEWTEGEQVTEVEIPRPRAFHMRGLDAKKLESDIDEQFKLLQKLLGQPAKFLDKMAFSDAQKLMEAVQSFLPSGAPATGQTPSQA